METLTTVPERIASGDTFAWTESFADFLASDYPSGDGWTLKYYFVGYTGTAAANFAITAAASGDSWAVSVAPATTKDYVPGFYRVSAVLEKTVDGTVTERITIPTSEKRCEITVGLYSPGTYDGRSPVKKILDAIEATIFKQATRLQKSYVVDGITIESYSQRELLEMRDKYAALYQAELCRAAGKSGIRKVGVRFVR